MPSVRVCSLFYPLPTLMQYLLRQSRLLIAMKTRHQVGMAVAMLRARSTDLVQIQQILFCSSVSLCGGAAAGMLLRDVRGIDEVWIRNLAHLE